MGKSTINGPFSMAMLNNQRVVSSVTFATPAMLGAWLCRQGEDRDPRSTFTAVSMSVECLLVK